MNIVFLRKSIIKPYIKIDNSKFCNEKRNLEYYLGRFIVKYGAKILYKKENLNIIDTLKPKFSDGILNFSISHSSDIVAAILCKDSVGLDVEEMKNRDFKAISEYLNIKEADKISFYQYWTSYEALIKANEKYITSFILDNYMFSVSSSIKTKLKIYEVKIPIDKINPSELINLNEANASSINENTVELADISTAVSEFLPPLILNIE